MPIDYTTPVGKVRLLISDLDETREILTDAMITGYLGLHGATTSAGTAGQVRRAAADALDAIATSEALVSKVIRTQDVTTDGAKLADALRKQAATLRTQADVADQDDADAEFGAVSVVEFTPYPRHHGHARAW